LNEEVKITKKEKRLTRLLLDLIYALLTFDVIKTAVVSYQVDPSALTFAIPFIIAAPGFYALKKLDIEWQRMVRKYEKNE